MRKTSLHSVNEETFDNLLESNMPELPPMDIAGQVTPWKTCMNYILTGLLLSTITLNFLCLNYILPTVGVILLFLGYRSLRRENQWFFLCFVLAVLRIVLLFPTLVINATLLHSSFAESTAATLLNIGNTLILLLQILFLGIAFQTLQRSCGLNSHAKRIFTLLIWYGMIVALAYVSYTGTIDTIVMLIGYLLIIYSIYKLSKELGEIGYLLKPSAPKISNRNLSIVLALILAVGLTCGYIFGNSYSMNWNATCTSAETDNSASDNIQKIQKHLTDLGFPQNVLSDLSQEDLATCENASRVVVNTSEESASARSTSEPDLRFTNIAVKLSNAPEHWMIIHHFQWLKNHSFYGTESIQLWPVYRDLSDGWQADGTISGQVLYDRNGITYHAPYHTLDTKTFSSDTIFWGEQTKSDVFATFSFPRKSVNCRGYVTYEIQENEPGYEIVSWINYTHQNNWFQYPVQTATDYQMYGGSDLAHTFQTTQRVLQFNPDH